MLARVQRTVLYTHLNGIGLRGSTTPKPCNQYSLILIIPAKPPNSEILRTLLVDNVETQQELEATQEPN